MEIEDRANHNFKDGIIEIEVGPNGEFDEETEKFILEKVQEAIDEGIYYSEEEANRLLDKMIEETEKCMKLNVHRKPI